MKELIYSSCLFYSSGVFGIGGIQIDDILILANNDLISVKQDKIKFAKIMIKNNKYFTSAYPLKLNGVQIKLHLDWIVLTKESQMGEILLVVDYVVDSTSFRGITKINLSPKV